ncbi:hypothetical protein DFJ73DRAFT_920500 [Zopfochytrium polystomum]|nr:hypothetical protein DFJ73DRAFT_920500 [Zopfochytrium polystomum]
MTLHCDHVIQSESESFQRSSQSSQPNIKSGGTMDLKATAESTDRLEPIDGLCTPNSRPKLTFIESVNKKWDEMMRGKPDVEAKWPSEDTLVSASSSHDSLARPAFASMEPVEGNDTVKATHRVVADDCCGEEKSGLAESRNAEEEPRAPPARPVGEPDEKVLLPSADGTIHPAKKAKRSISFSDTVMYRCISVVSLEQTQPAAPPAPKLLDRTRAPASTRRNQQLGHCTNRSGDDDYDFTDEKRADDAEDCEVLCSSSTCGSDNGNDDDDDDHDEGGSDGALSDIENSWPDPDEHFLPLLPSPAVTTVSPAASRPSSAASAASSSGPAARSQPQGGGGGQRDVAEARGEVWDVEELAQMSAASRSLVERELALRGAAVVAASASAAAADAGGTAGGGSRGADEMLTPVVSIGGGGGGGSSRMQSLLSGPPPLSPAVAGGAVGTARSIHFSTPTTLPSPPLPPPALGPVGHHRLRFSRTPLQAPRSFSTTIGSPEPMRRAPSAEDAEFDSGAGAFGAAAGRLAMPAPVSSAWRIPRAAGELSLPILVEGGGIVGRGDQRLSMSAGSWGLGSGVGRLGNGGAEAGGMGADRSAGSLGAVGLRVGGGAGREYSQTAPALISRNEHVVIASPSMWLPDSQAGRRAAPPPTRNAAADGSRGGRASECIDLTGSLLVQTSATHQQRRHSVWWPDEWESEAADDSTATCDKGEWDSDDAAHLRSSQDSFYAFDPVTLIVAPAPPPSTSSSCEMDAPSFQPGLNCAMPIQAAVLVPSAKKKSVATTGATPASPLTANKARGAGKKGVSTKGKSVGPTNGKPGSSKTTGSTTSHSPNHGSKQRHQTSAVEDNAATAEQSASIVSRDAQLPVQSEGDDGRGQSSETRDRSTQGNVPIVVVRMDPRVELEEVDEVAQRAEQLTYKAEAPPAASSLSGVADAVATHPSSANTVATKLSSSASRDDTKRVDSALTMRPASTGKDVDGSCTAQAAAADPAVVPRSDDAAGGGGGAAACAEAIKLDAQPPPPPPPPPPPQPSQPPSVHSSLAALPKLPGIQPAPPVAGNVGGGGTDSREAPRGQDTSGSVTAEVVGGVGRGGGESPPNLTSPASGAERWLRHEGGSVSDPLRALGAESPAAAAAVLAQPIPAATVAAPIDTMSVDEADGAVARESNGGRIEVRGSVARFWGWLWRGRATATWKAHPAGVGSVSDRPAAAAAEATVRRALRDSADDVWRVKPVDADGAWFSMWRGRGRWQGRRWSGSGGGGDRRKSATTPRGRTVAPSGSARSVGVLDVGEDDESDWRAGGGGGGAVFCACEQNGRRRDSAGYRWAATGGLGAIGLAAAVEQLEEQYNKYASPNRPLFTSGSTLKLARILGHLGELRIRE